MKNSLVLAAGAALVLAASVAPAARQEPIRHNPVVPERVEIGGWTPLFDGHSLNGWRGYKQRDASETRWRVEDGTLTVPAGSPGATNQRDLVTDATYAQFDLRWEWKLAEGGNSGVKYFVLEDRNDAIGHEYQMIDDEREPDAKVGPHHQTAALYDVLAGTDRPTKPAGEWNISEIIVRGLHVEHWLNGRRVLQYELGSPELKSAIARSKFRDVPRFGTPQNGHILLQDHGSQVWFRKVEISAVSSAPAKPARRDAVRVYVFATMPAGGAATDEDKARDAAAREVRDAIGRRKGLVMVDGRADADVIVEVTASEQHDEGGGFGGASLTRLGDAIIHLHVTSGDRESDLKGMGPGGWGRAAKDAADHVEKWIARTR